MTPPSAKFIERGARRILMITRRRDIGGDRWRVAFKKYADTLKNNHEPIDDRLTADNKPGEISLPMSHCQTQWPLSVSATILAHLAPQLIQRSIFHNSRLLSRRSQEYFHWYSLNSTQNGDILKIWYMNIYQRLQWHSKFSWLSGAILSTAIRGRLIVDDSVMRWPTSILRIQYLYASAHLFSVSKYFQPRWSRRPHPHARPTAYIVPQWNNLGHRFRAFSVASLHSARPSVSRIVANFSSHGNDKV